MVTTTSEVWTVDGTVLNTLAWNITTIEGRESIPERRGSNIEIIDRPGRMWVPKIPDEKSMQLAMWVRGCDEDGNIDESQRGRFMENWEQLKALFGVYDRLLEIDKTVLIGSELHHRRCHAEVVGDMALAARGPSAGTFVVDLNMPDPYWYGPEQEVWIRLGSPPTGAGWPVTWPVTWTTPTDLPPRVGELVVHNKGSAPVEPLVQFVGPVTGPRLVHVESGRVLDFDMTLAENQVLEVDPVYGTVRVDGSSRYSTMRRGSRWMKMEARSMNTFRYEVDAGQGMARMQWRPAYL